MPPKTTVSVIASRQRRELRGEHAGAPDRTRQQELDRALLELRRHDVRGEDDREQRQQQIARRVGEAAREERPRDRLRIHVALEVVLQAAELEAGPPREEAGMRPSRSQFWIRAMRSCVSTRQSFFLNRSRAARLREDDEADERDEDEHDDAEAPLLRELQNLVLDEAREPHTVSPPVISRKTSSSEEDGRSTVKTSTPAAEKRAQGASGTRSGGMRAVTTPSRSAVAAVWSDGVVASTAPNAASTSAAARGRARAHAHAIRRRAGGELAHRARAPASARGG